MTDLMFSFSPWCVFLLASRFLPLPGAVALGFLAAVAVLVRAAARHRAHMLELAGVCYFLALALVMVLTSARYVETWSRYAQLGSHLVLSALIFGSILCGRPFTEAYARQNTPHRLWGTREFRSINRRISAVWGLAFVAGDISLALALAGTGTGRPVLLRVIIPFGALFLAWRYTRDQQAQIRREEFGPQDRTGTATASSHPSVPPKERTR